MWLFLCNTIQLIIIKLCTTFQNPKSSTVVAEKSLTEKKVHMYYIGVTEGKIENLKKRRQGLASYFSFT